MQHTLSPGTTPHQTPGSCTTLQSSEAPAGVCVHVHVHACVKDGQTDRQPQSELVCAVYPGLVLKYMTELAMITDDVLAHVLP